MGCYQAQKINTVLDDIRSNTSSTRSDKEKLSLLLQTWNPKDQIDFIVNCIKKFYEVQAGEGAEFKVSLMEPDVIGKNLIITAHSYAVGQPHEYTDHFRIDGRSAAALAWNLGELVVVPCIQTELHTPISELGRPRMYASLLPHHNEQEGCYAGLAIKDEFSEQRLFVINLYCSEKIFFDTTETCRARTEEELREFGQRIAFEIRYQKIHQSLM